MTGQQLLDILEATYRAHMSARDRRILDGNVNTIQLLPNYEGVEIGMREMITQARRALGLPTKEWDR